MSVDDLAKTMPSAPSRSTVLPQVEWSGAEPTLRGGRRSRYEELGLLGEGGMGQVVLTRDHDIDRTVAVKRLPGSAEPGLVVRFIEEIRTVGRLQHPNIAPVHDVGVDEAGRYYFVMKHLEGETLEQVIARLRAGDPAAHARFTFPVRIQLFLSVLNALAYAHQQGVIHRDLKPANVMVGPFGEVTLMDWGIAKRRRGPALPDSPSAPAGAALPNLTRAGSVMGTPLYMSPEQARGEVDTLDERSDLYSAAVLLHEFLHLEHYLEGRTDVQSVLQGVQDVMPRWHTVDPRGSRYQVPVELDWFLGRALRKDPALRHASAEAMADELQRIMRGECQVQCARTFTKRMLHEAAVAVDRWPTVSVVAITLLTGLAVGGLLLAAVSLLG